MDIDTVIDRILTTALREAGAGALAETWSDAARTASIAARAARKGQGWGGAKGKKKWRTEARQAYKRHADSRRMGAWDDQQSASTNVKRMQDKIHPEVFNSAHSQPGTPTRGEYMRQEGARARAAAASYRKWSAASDMAAKKLQSRKKYRYG